MIGSIKDFYSYIFQQDEGITTAYFKTRTNTEYRVYFYPANEYFDGLNEGSFIYEFGYFFGFTKLAPNEDKVEPLDCMVRNTIADIVNNFFDEKGIDRILIFHCSDEDGKSAKRAFCFDLWYQVTDTNNCFEKIDEQIIITNEDIATSEIHYTSIIIECSNPFLDAIKSEFQSIKEKFIANK